MKSVMALRKTKTASSSDLAPSREAESSSMMDDDMKSVRSSATASSKLGGFLKNKLHQTASFSASKLNKLGGRSKHSSNEIPDHPGDDYNEDDEQYHENDETRAAKVLRETTNVSNNGKAIGLDFHAEDAQKLRMRLREAQQELEAERLRNQQMKRELDTDQETSRRKLSELRSALDRERDNYQSMVSGDGVDDTVRRQADTIQELQAVTEALQMRVELLEGTCAENDRNREISEQANKAEADSLKERIQCLETENGSLKRFMADNQSTTSSEAVRVLEKERDMLRQRLFAMEAENKSKGKTDNNTTAALQERFKVLESENAELKRSYSTEMKNLQMTISKLENDLRVSTSKKSSDAELGSLQVQLAEKERELASIASAAETEINRLEDSLKAQQSQKEVAEKQLQALQKELVEKNKQASYWKEKLEHDEHYQRAAEAARQLLRQKKISKAEYDQVMKAAQEASRVWGQ